MVWLDLFYTAASATFIQVGTFVGITLLFFGYIDYKTQGGVINSFKKYKNLQVIFGVILGLTPGCGGAILMMPLYLKGYASFGSVVATLIATMGDAAFVLLVRDPISLVWILIISGITGIVTGYLIDYFKIGVSFSPVYTEEQLQQDSWQFRPEKTKFEEGDMPAQIAIVPNTVISKDTAKIHNLFYNIRHDFAFYFFWVMILLAFPLGIMNLMQIDIESALPIKNLGMIGVIGTVFSVVYTIASRKVIADDNLPEECSKLHSLKETFIHNAEETAFVIMWVFVALFIYELGIFFLGGEEVLAELMAKTGYMVVIVALLVGLIPGCGPHIVLATMYINGVIPFSALLTNAICNDGDALFPILAMNTKSAFWASVLGAIPALIIGTVFYLLER